MSFVSGRPPSRECTKVIDSGELELGYRDECLNQGSQIEPFQSLLAMVVNCVIQIEAINECYDSNFIPLK